MATQPVSQHVFYEEEGSLKAGSILADHDSSLHIETANGKRIKIKSANVLMRFTQPHPLELLEQVQQQARQLDPQFLWEASGQQELAFADLAVEYFGRSPSAVEAAAIATCLHAAPMYFYKKGKGRYKPAPPEALRAALAGVEKKRLQAEQISVWTEQLKNRQLPEALHAKLPSLLYRPDKNSLEYKALAQACDELKTNPLTLLDGCGAISSTHDYHFNRFLFQYFPRGTGFPSYRAPQAPPLLPRAEVLAFSIDDASTTEIDDAFSVTPLADNAKRIGIHIAAPALGILADSDLDRIARERLSTVYMPGNKITMLPDEVIAAYTLAAGELRPALSIYVEVDATGAIRAHETRLEQIEIAFNLRHHELERCTDPAALIELPCGDALHTLWQVAVQLEAARGKPETQRVDYQFVVEGDRVTITPRLRGSPLDKLVAEWMIFTNATWGKQLADAGIAGIYRTQQGGKVKMSSRPQAHEGLGVAQYLWSSSPIRRYTDLVNQRQLIAQVQGVKPPYRSNDAVLFSALADFEATYAAYAELQNQLEHYWCLRWLLQENVQQLTATIIRENLLRFDRLPIVMRIADLPFQAPSTSVLLAVEAVDLLANTLRCRFIKVNPN